MPPGLKVMADNPTPDVAVAPPLAVPGVMAAVGHRALEGVYRGLPSSRLMLMVSLDDGIQIDDLKPIPVLLAGLHLQAAKVHKARGQGVVQLAVHPLASRALFGMPAAEVSGAALDVAAALGRPAARLHEQVAEATNWSAAFACVVRYLQGARRAEPVRPEVAHAWQLLARSRGRMPVGYVAQQVGMTPRHLATLFQREVGHTTKTVAMLMRFEYVTRRIAGAGSSSGPVDLARIAVESGFADQAHLTRQFARFAGVSPTTWLAEDFRNVQDSLQTYGSGWAGDDYDSGILGGNDGSNLDGIAPGSAFGAAV